MKARTELRTAARDQHQQANIRLAWIDESGEMRMGQARLIDISEGGFAVELRDAPRRTSRVRFQSNRLKLNGVGEIRHCERSGWGYRVGVEFTEGTRWSAPARIGDQERWDWGFSAA